MNRHETDILARLAAANPVRGQELQGGSEPPWVEALLERILDEPAAGPSRPPRRPRRVVLAGALAAAVLAVVGVIVLLGGPSRETDPVAEAEAAVSNRDGVFHIVTRLTASEEGRPGTPLWMETWAAARGGRSHSLVYQVTSGGSRGRLLGETVSRRGGALDSVTYHAPPGGAAFPASGEPAAPRPLAYVLSLLRSGRVRKKEQVRFAGREAWLFTIERRARKSSVVFPTGRASTPAYTQHTRLIVDGRSHLPLLLRSTGLVTTLPDRAGGRVTFPRVTTTQRFTRFERLTDSQGAPALQPSPRFKDGR